jgi:hypothetical protein
MYTGKSSLTDAKLALNERNTHNSNTTYHICSSWGCYEILSDIELSMPEWQTFRKVEDND